MHTSNIDWSQNSLDGQRELQCRRWRQDRYLILQAEIMTFLDKSIVSSWQLSLIGLLYPCFWLLPVSGLKILCTQLWRTALYLSRSYAWYAATSKLSADIPLSRTMVGMRACLLCKELRECSFCSFNYTKGHVHMYIWIRNKETKIGQQHWLGMEN